MNSDFRHDVNVPASFWDLTQCRIFVPCRRFGTTYRSHLQGSSSPRRMSA